jgi:hypothetical protein
MKLVLHFIFIHLKMFFFGVLAVVLFAAVANTASFGVKMHEAGVPILPFSTYFSK